MTKTELFMTITGEIKLYTNTPSSKVLYDLLCDKKCSMILPIFMTQYI